MAGVETSAATVEWAMTELLRNPNVMERAKREIESEVGRDPIVRESDVVNIEYSRCVVKETLRLHPAGRLLVPHESIEGCNDGGYYIPPKTWLFVNIWAIGSDESVWEDALEFEPERFIGSSIDLKGQHFELLSFGTATSNCCLLEQGGGDAQGCTWGSLLFTCLWPSTNIALIGRWRVIWIGMKCLD